MNAVPRIPLVDGVVLRPADLDAAAKVRSVDDDANGRGFDDDIVPEPDRIHERAGGVSRQVERDESTRTRQADGQRERD
jgi:hypothetical protein